MIQRSLFPDAPTPAYRRDRDTSVAAADAVRGVASDRRTHIIAELERCGSYGATVSELMQRLGVTERNMVAPRVSELSSERYGALVCDSGMRRTQPGRRCAEIVWRLR